MTTINLDERKMDGMPVRVTMDTDADFRKITVKLFFREVDFAGLRTECGATALGAFHHPLAQIDGAADTLAELLAYGPYAVAPESTEYADDVPEGGQLRELRRDEEDGA